MQQQLVTPKRKKTVPELYNERKIMGGKQNMKSQYVCLLRHYNNHATFSDKHFYGKKLFTCDAAYRFSVDIRWLHRNVGMAILKIRNFLSNKWKSW